jgi:serine/threonine-protein kinase
MRITLTVTEGPHKGRVFTFDRHENFIVGRSKLAHFRLPVKDKYFSRIHFLVEVNPPHCRLMDMGSRNGTFLNGGGVKEADLRDGDRIKAGKTILCVSVDRDEAPAAAAAPPGTPPAPPPVAAPVAAASDYGTLRPAPPAAPVPRPRRPVPVGGRCRACAGPVTDGGAPRPEGLFPADLSPICPACQEEIRRQPQPIADYVIARKLGEGGMGVIYLALRKADGTPVALKTITPAVDPEPGDVQRFFREASILRDLSHPNIVAFHEMGCSGGRLYFAMDYVRGTDAARLLKGHGPLPVGRAVGLVCQLLGALEYAHAREYVHRDIKPANLLVAEQGGREVVKLADFGLARVYQASKLSGLTLRGDLGGTVAFMAPEQVTHFRDAKPPVDLFAAGATLYNLLTDRLVHDLPREVGRQLLMVLQDDPVPIRARRPDIPDGLAALIHRALARDPKARFADVTAMRKALVAFGP